MKRLVVTADDVGLAAGMTRGALHAHDHGIVTACSVAATGAGLDEAVAAVKERARLAVGVHWVLTGERPLSPAREIPSLVGRDGAFLRDFRAFAVRYLLGGIRTAEVVKELRRQTELLLSRGLTLTHANSHQHLHLLPELFPPLAALARELGIARLRVTEESDPGMALPRGLEMRVLSTLGRRARLWLPPGVDSTGRTLGIRCAGRLDLLRLERALRTAGPGEDAFELVCHPGLDGAALRGHYAWGYRWEEETEALTSSRTRELVAECGFELASWPGGD